MSMGRRRSSNLSLPPRLHRKGRVYYYTPYENGKLRWVRLSDSYPEALAKWAEYEGAHRSGSTVGHALDRYVIEILPKKAEATQREYRRQTVRLRRVFGATKLALVRPSHVAQYLDQHDSPVLANREMAMLSSVYQEAIRWGWVESNPCRGVRRNTEKRRTRHITKKEVAQLGGHLDGQMQCIVDLVLLTALRKKDVLSIRLSDLTDEGLLVQISKTGHAIIFEWTPSLRAVIDRARALRRKVGSMYLFATRNGQPYTTSGFDSIWQRKLRRSGLIDFRFHDLRARALTDAKAQGGRDYAQALADHESGETTERYIRGREVRRVKPLEK